MKLSFFFFTQRLGLKGVQEYNKQTPFHVHGIQRYQRLYLRPLITPNSQIKINLFYQLFFFLYGVRTAEEPIALIARNVINICTLIDIAQQTFPTTAITVEIRYIILLPKSNQCRKISK